MAVETETVTNKIGHFVILKNPDEWTGNHVRRGDEAWMRDIIDRYADETKRALDIGSCYGLHTLHMSRKFATVWAFEPQYLMAKLSERTFFLNGAKNVKVINVACSDASGFVEFPKIDYHGIGNVGGLSAAYDVGPDKNTNAAWDGVSRVSVPCDTIDNLLSDADPLTIGFIKMDVEGYELKALKGAEKTLRENLCPLAIEIKDFPEGNLEKVHTFLTGIGYNNRESCGNSKWDYLYRCK